MISFPLLLGLFIVVLSTRPSLERARHVIADAHRSIRELERRKQALSRRIRELAKESLNQRLTSGQDSNETDDLRDRLRTLQQRIRDLEAMDRRILVLDERRGLSETGWILRVRRDPAAAPPLEPRVITALWDEGRYVFFFAGDPARARRKAQIRFPEEHGFSVIEVIPHAGDLTDIPKLSGPAKIA